MFSCQVISVQTMQITNHETAWLIASYAKYLNANKPSITTQHFQTSDMYTAITGAGYSAIYKTGFYNRNITKR